MDIAIGNSPMLCSDAREWGRGRLADEDYTALSGKPRDTRWPWIPQDDSRTPLRRPASCTRSPHRPSQLGRRRRAVMGGSRFPGGLPRVLWTGPAPWPSGTCKRGRAAMVGETACVDSPRARRCPGAGHGYPRVGRIRSVRSWRWGMTRRPRRSPLGRARSPWNRRLARRGRGNRAAWHGTRPAPRGALIARRSTTAVQGIRAAIPRPLAATMSHASK